MPLLGQSGRRTGTAGWTGHETGRFLRAGEGLQLSLGEGWSAAFPRGAHPTAGCLACLNDRQLLISLLKQGMDTT